MLLRTAFAALLSAVSWAGPALAGSFVYTTINPPTAASGFTNLVVNNHGQVAGSYTDITDPNTSIGFFWEAGVFTKIAGPRPQYADSGLTAINDSGIAVGYSFNVTAPLPHYSAFVFRSVDKTARIILPAYDNMILYGVNSKRQMIGTQDCAYPARICSFLFAGSTVTRIVAPGFEQAETTLRGINNAGTILGVVNDPKGGVFLYSAGSYEFLPMPLILGQVINPFWTFLSEDGRVFGRMQNPARPQETLGFIYDNGKYEYVKFPGSNEGSVVSVNGKEVVGTYSKPGYIFGSYVKLGKKYYDINVPNGRFTTITGGSPSGLLVGTYRDAAGQQHGFLAVCPAAQQPCTQ